MAKQDPYASLRIREFTIFLLVRFLLVFGWSMQFIVVEWQVYSITKDPLSLGIIGLMEIENDGDEAKSAISDLVDALNAEVGASTYAYVSAGVIAPETAAPDEIAVGLIYKTSTVDFVEFVI